MIVYFIEVPRTKTVRIKSDTRNRVGPCLAIAMSGQAHVASELSADSIAESLSIFTMAHGAFLAFARK
jgi:hypothetical protein